MRTLPVSGTAAPIRPLRPRALSPVQLAVVAVAAVDPPAPSRAFHMANGPLKKGGPTVISPATIATTTAV